MGAVWRLTLLWLLGIVSALYGLKKDSPGPSYAPTRMDLANLPVDFNYTVNVKECIDSLLSLPYSLVGIAAASSSDTSALAESSDPYGFAADIGNFDMCMRQQGQLAHCLAGSIKLGDPFVALPPHSGICVPATCGPKELQDPALLGRLRREIAVMTGVPGRGDGSTALSASLSRPPGEASWLLTQRGQQRFIYYVKLENTMQLTSAANTSYTCGAHRASMTFDRYLFFLMFAVLLLTVALSTVYQMTLDGEGESRGNNERDDRNGKWDRWRATVVNAFSLVNTVPYIFQPRPMAVPGCEEPDQFLVLDGLRAISILWIILGHTLTVSTSIGLLNPAAVLPPNGFLKSASAQLLLSSRFAVDTFFFISGFLVVLSLLKRLSTLSGPAASANAPSDGASVMFPRPKSQILLSYGNKDFELSPVPVAARLSGASSHGGSGEQQLLSAFAAAGGYQGVATSEDGGLTLTLTTSEDGGLVAAAGREATEVPGLWSWLPSFYVHRLLRIWPPYVFCLLVWWKIGVLLGSGPFWYRWLSFTHRCDMYFWTNLLFVNNLHPYDVSEADECFYISWYLADDMQFYLVSPLFVCAYLHSDKLGVALVLLAVIVSGGAGYLQSLRHGWSAHSFDGLNVTQYSHHFYTKPQYRLPAYAVG